MQFEIEMNEKDKQKLTNMLYARTPIPEPVVQQFVERPGFLSKIVQRTSSYYYEVIDEQEALDLITEEGGRYRDAYLELSQHYILSENFPRAQMRKEKPRYASQSMPSDTTMVQSLEEVHFPECEGNILVKPNFVSTGSYPETTDVKVLEYVLMMIRKHNTTGRIIIGDGPSLFFSSDLVFQEHHLVQLARRYDAELMNFNKCEYAACRASVNTNLEPILFVPEVLYEVDVLINLANLKEHLSTGISAAAKNHLGLIAPFQRLNAHQQDGLLDLIRVTNRTIGANFHVVDARRILKGAQQRLYGGYEISGSGFIFGTDATNVDECAERLLVLLG